MKDIIYLKHHYLFLIPTEDVPKKADFLPSSQKSYTTFFLPLSAELITVMPVTGKASALVSILFGQRPRNPPHTALCCYVLEIMNVETQVFPMFVFQS